MKYYCEKCRDVLVTNDNTSTMELCPKCISADGTHKIMFPFPDYETPEQYEKRTGKPYPDNGAVYVLTRYHFDDKPNWYVTAYFEYKKTAEAIAQDKVYGTKLFGVVIADPPVPPPDDWRPV